MRKEKENLTICSSESTRSYPAFHTILTSTPFFLLNINMGRYAWVSESSVYERVKHPHGEREEPVLCLTKSWHLSNNFKEVKELTNFQGKISAEGGLSAKTLRQEHVWRGCGVWGKQRNPCGHSRASGGECSKTWRRVEGRGQPPRALQTLKIKVKSLQGFSKMWYDLTYVYKDLCLWCWK